MLNPMDSGVDPTIVDWLQKTLKPEALRLVESDSLVALQIAVGATKSEPLPDSLIASWVRLMRNTRRIADQSEVALIEKLRAQGESWDKIEDLLAIDRARGHYDRLIEDLEATLPINLDDSGKRIR
ncbi:hypothetical protein [Amycolatopsis antarctica]|uniref:hypothetical protein n=1 Tax=Amycolatopsis antarctica TaxID=1854586 RepID=UPI001054A138|nr:hypothetical protein [Amycolatopsis antarctica]